MERCRCRKDVGHNGKSYHVNNYNNENNYNNGNYKGGKPKGKGRNTRWDAPPQPGKGKGKAEGHNGEKGQDATQQPVAPGSPWRSSGEFCYACALEGVVARHDPMKCAVHKRYREFRAAWESQSSAQGKSGQGEGSAPADPAARE